MEHYLKFFSFFFPFYGRTGERDLVGQVEGLNSALNLLVLVLIPKRDHSYNGMHRRKYKNKTPQCGVLCFVI